MLASSSEKEPRVVIPAWIYLVNALLLAAGLASLAVGRLSGPGRRWLFRFGLDLLAIGVFLLVALTVLREIGAGSFILTGLIVAGLLFLPNLYRAMARLLVPGIRKLESTAPMGKYPTKDALREFAGITILLVCFLIARGR